MIPTKMDRKEFAKRKRLCAEYLARIARAPEEQRKGLLAELAEKLYDQYGELRIGLMKSFDDLYPMLEGFVLYCSTTIIPLLAVARPNDSESEAIWLAIEGRQSEWLARMALLFPAEEAAMETGNSEVIGAPGRRRSYRQELRQWMTQKGLRTLPEAAEKLNISLSALKSISSERGKCRYGNATLTRILLTIGLGEPVK